MERDVLQRMIQEYRKKIETYQAMVAEWEKELGLNPSAVVATGDADSSNAKAKPPVGSSVSAFVRNFQFFGKTQTDAAKALLEVVGHPLTTEEIMEGVEKGGVKLGGKTPKDKKQNFYTILNRSKEFGRAAKNTWGVVGWPGIVKDDEADDEETGKEKKEEAQK
jgi:hypothetical protein